MSGIALGLELLQAAKQIAAAYARIRALAAQNGATDAQLAEADARFGRIVADPLAGSGEATPPIRPSTGATDPTSIEYNTKGAAIVHTSDEYPYVVEKANGKFVVWSVAGPFPGTKVYP